MCKLIFDVCNKRENLLKTLTLIFSFTVGLMLILVVAPQAISVLFRLWTMEEERNNLERWLSLASVKSVMFTPSMRLLLFPRKSLEAVLK